MTTRHRSARASLGASLLVAGTFAAAPFARPLDAQTSSVPPASATGRWTVRTVEHVDLWLHAFALVSSDSAPVPLYRRGYRDSVLAVRSKANVLSALDGNRATLSRRLAESPAYLQAQFLPFEFATWEEMQGAAERFLQYEGNPQRAPNRQVASQVALFASIFGSAADRDWLRLFIASVSDERSRYFAAEHARQRAARSAVVASVDSLWTNGYRAKFERFMNNTGQRSGELLLSLSLGGEGRTGAGGSGAGGTRGTIAAVTWPGRTDDAAEALLVLAHEITGSMVGSVVEDNTTPAEKRAGASDRYVSLGQAHAGAVLLERIAPELVEPYKRYYLRQAGTDVGRASAADVAAAFDRVFALPRAIVDGLAKQIEIVLGGI